MHVWQAGRQESNIIQPWLLLSEKDKEYCINDRYTLEIITAVIS